jgi:hypothetical protein
MSTSLRIGNIPGSLVAMLLACGLVACTSQEAPAGGTGGSSAGGSAGSTTTTGNGGSGGGNTGTSTSAGSDGTLCPTPSQVITDFTYTPSDAGVSTSEVRFGSSGTLQGGESFYPSTLTSDVTQGTWHLSGTISDYSGFALYFDLCDHLDAKAFKGISFKISGSVPQGNAITMGVGTIADTPTGAWMLSPGGKTTAKATDAGRCTPTSGTQYYHPGCGDPTTQIPVTSSPVVQSVTWATLTGGTPVASPNPAEITSIYWFFPWTGTGATPYTFDLVIDDLQFIP